MKGLGWLLLGLIAGAPAWARDRAKGPEDSWGEYMERHGEVQEGLPPWMTQGEQVRLAVVDELLRQQSPRPALEILAQMRAEGLEGPEVDLRQGIALRMDGVTSESEHLLLRAQKRMKGDPRPSGELCVLFADLQRLEEAIEQCRKATRDDEADAAAWNNLGFLLLAAGRSEEAVEATEQAVRRDGSEPRYRNNLGLAQAAVGRESEAFRTLGSTMSKADAAYMVGLAVERRDGPEAAESWYHRALEHEPDHEATLAHLRPPGEPRPSPGPGPGSILPGSSAGSTPAAEPAGTEAP